MFFKIAENYVIFNALTRKEELCGKNHTITK